MNAGQPTFSGGNGLEPVLEVFDLPAPYQTFNPVIQVQLSGDNFTNSSTRQEPDPDIGEWRPVVVLAYGRQTAAAYRLLFPNGSCTWNTLAI